MNQCARQFGNPFVLLNQDLPFAETLLGGGTLGGGQ
jgi:hypothetical protein